MSDRALCRHCRDAAAWPRSLVVRGPAKGTALAIAEARHCYPTSGLLGQARFVARLHSGVVDARGTWLRQRQSPRAHGLSTQRTTRRDLSRSAVCRCGWQLPRCRLACDFWWPWHFVVSSMMEGWKRRTRPFVRCHHEASRSVVDGALDYHGVWRRHCAASHHEHLWVVVAGEAMWIPCCHTHGQLKQASAWSPQRHRWQVWPPSGGGKHTALEAALRHGHAYFMTWHEDMPLGLQKPQPRHARLFGFVWRC